MGQSLLEHAVSVRNTLTEGMEAGMLNSRLTELLAQLNGLLNDHLRNHRNLNRQAVQACLAEMAQTGV